MDKNLLQKAKAPMIALILFNLFAFNMIAKAQNTFGGGSGTYTDPYIISTTDHWIELASSVNAVSNPSTFFNQYFRLDADLDFNGISFQPVGNCFSWFDGDSVVSPRIFSGKFNGNGHSIKNVTYHGDNDFENGQGVGLFGYAGNAFIQNLTLAGNSTITGYNNVGGIVGKLESNSTVTNCLVEEGVTIAQAPVSSCRGTFGGIVGMCMGTYIFVNNCFSYATVAYTCDEAAPNTIVGVGGVVGATGWPNSNPIIEIRNCGFFGQVTGITYVGAICGLKDSSANVTSCYVGGDCTTGAIGVEGSSEGTNNGISIKYVCAIFCGENVGATYYTEGLASCNGRNVYDYNTKVDLKLEYTGTPPTGYTIWDAHYEVDGGTLNKDPRYSDYIDHANNRYILRLPSQPKSTITFVSLDLLRDISYEPWVRITVPACLYTGENHTPQPLVIDTKDGASDTLRRNIDYSIFAGDVSDPSYCDPGNYSISIEGKGDFRGEALKVFTIFELDPDFSEGSGTETDPYIIRTTEQMDVLAAKVNAGDEKTGVCFRLEADLDYTGKTYTPVGNANYGFRGIFDGNGHTISNVNLNINQDNVGLFGSLGGTVKNLTFDNSNIQNSGRFIGGIAGSCNGGTIKGCIVTNNVNINGTQNVGGIVGEVTQWGRIDNCLSLAQSIVGSSKVGGIAGDVSSAILTNNYYAGYYNVGGINGNDVTGAVRGYAITSENGITVGLEGSTGLAYGGVVYGGQGQEIVLTLNVGMSNNPLPQCYSISAGILTYNDNGTYTVILPMQNVIIGFLNDLIESNGMHYLLSCDDSHTAILIHSDSYATIYAASVEDFEYQGTQYTVIEIADNAFDGCEHLQWFDCHANLLSIGDHAFRNCDSLEYLGLYHIDTPPTVGTGCFDGLGLDTLMLMVPFCSRYEYAIHPVWGQFGEIQPDGECEYNFTNQYGSGDRLWSNPENWAEGEVPGEGAQVGIMSDCEMDADVTVGSITIGGYYDEEYGCYEHLTVKDGTTLTATSFIYNSGDARNFIIEDGAQVVHPNAGAKATVQKAVSAYSTQSGVNNGWHLIALPLTGSIDVDSVGNMIGGEYDLYAYDESTAYWKNSKNTENSFTALEATKGYLYAHGEDVTLEFSGTLQNSSDTISVPLSYTTVAHLKGFNLVGNPFPCEAYLDRAYYVLGANGTGINPNAIQGTVPIPPCTAVFVKADAEGETVVFSRTAP